MSEVDVGSTAVEVEPSHHYSITCCCHMTDGSRRAVWQNGVWDESAYEAKMWHWIPPWRKNGTHWHSSTLAEGLWSPNSGCEHSEAVGGAFQQWWQWQWVTSAGADFYKHGMQALVHCCACIARGGDCVVAEDSLYQILSLYSLYLL